MQKAHSFYAMGFVFGVLMSEGTKKKTRSFYAAGLLFTSTGNRVPFRPLPWQPIDGGLLPRRGFLTAYTVRTPQTPLPRSSSVFHTANRAASR